MLRLPDVRVSVSDVPQTVFYGSVLRLMCITNCYKPRAYAQMSCYLKLNSGLLLLGA